MKTYQTIGAKTIDTAIDLDAIKDIALHDDNLGVKSRLQKSRKMDPYIEPKSSKY